MEMVYQTIPICLIHNYFDQDTSVYLGTILFDKYIGDLKTGKRQETAFESYQKSYASLAEIVNQLDGHPRQFNMLEHVLRYSSFENSDHIIEPNIARFYFGNN